MATSVGGTNYSWHALEPFPIETPLAEEATGSAQGSKSAGIALSLLGRYQAERDMQQAQYGEDVRQQQAYQRDVLASQMMDNTMRARVARCHYSGRSMQVCRVQAQMHTTELCSN